MRPADFEGWLVPREVGAWSPKRLRVWMAPEESAGPQEWHGHLQVEGCEDYHRPRPVPGGSPLQATMLTFLALDLLAKREGGQVRSVLFPEDQE